ncbi:MAG: TRAP transporter substrate-binding protein DctP [Polyangia bacterium]
MRPLVFFPALLLALAASPPPARAEPVVLKLASAVPEGTAWAREGKAFARDVELTTHGNVRIKWYLGGIAGDEIEVGDRIRRGQLDGAASGGMLCGQMAPSMRITRVAGLFQKREELTYVLGRMKPLLDGEFRQRGFDNLWEVPLGPGVLFTRDPVRTVEDLRRIRVWTWNLDEVLNMQIDAAGVHAVALPLSEAARAYDDHRTDGFVAIPSAGLAFQWSAQARYVTDLRLGFLTGCLMVANRALDPLPLEDRRALEAAAAKFRARVDVIGRQTDDALLGGLFQRQGLRTVAVSSAFRAEFFEVMRQARERLGEKLVSHALLQNVLGMLADYRAEHDQKP